MTITPYVALSEIKTLVNITDTNDDTRLQAALDAACRSIDDFCGRRFYVDGSASARQYRIHRSSLTPESQPYAKVDEFSTMTGLIVATDDDADGIYETVWTANTDYIVEPFNQMRDGIQWAYDTITPVGTKWLPYTYGIGPTSFAARRPRLQVTALWGWPSVPEPVKQACRLLTVANWRKKDAPFGVAGMAASGFAIRVNQDPDVERLLNRYTDISVG